MANTIGIFDHEVIGGREHRLPDGELYPTSPFVRIQLQQWFESEDGISISPQLMTDAEIDSFNVQLRKDLDAVHQRAKADLRSAR